MRGFISFKKYCIATVTKLLLVARKIIIVVTIGLTKFAKILIVKIKSNEIIVNLCLENEEIHCTLLLH